MSLLQRLEKQKILQQEQVEQPEFNHTRRDLRQHHKSQFQELTLTLHKKVIAKLKDLPEDVKENPDLLAQKIESLVNELLDEENENLARTQRQLIVAEIIDETIGFGPITPLLNDPNISEVMVNGPNQVYVERDGKLILTGVKFRDSAHVLHIIEKIVAPIGRRIDESMPMVDARLPDGSRVNAIIPPLALNGPTVTIRKFARDPYTVEDLIKFGTLTPQMAQFLEACVKARLNIVVSGGTGSGKTTTLNVLSSFIPADERIITIEDAAELQLRQEHVITLESRPPNIEGKGAITIRDLVRNSLRMRPERIVVGEVRSGEALDMLQAMNTGHDGSLTTGHANTPRDMLSRLETMVLMAGMDLPVRAIREQISSAIDLIIQQNRFRDGTRKITHITEVQGMEGEVIVLQDLFTFRQTGVDENGRVKGTFQSSGIRPKFIHRLESAGFKLPPDIFSPSVF
ncbi:CpaF family protein [Desulforamulus hydrothermalis]|uniref:Type II secretion system protein E n=1 Tax=Desulforamulus hydrothermalis Lam5 = DSM 18033 TaxID=1121428 RepID=K8DX11_9FIRM|nr:CpaF family protein [Desulforamulus hydrothermalis]CCO07024.1 Type II secretion system protein E [Desulforamulus hydrothermalis Lam5 = DSM 18033]SHG97345.1 pilus assembly protein CpaF [Desulforamulus hydrothermalis Lam5 = DSM 18033]